MSIHNTTKEFFNTSESKIYAEFNNVSIQDQENRKGILLIGANPQWKGSENNRILNDMFYSLVDEKKYCVMKILFRSYESELFRKCEYQDIRYIRDASVAVDYFFSKFSCVKFFVVMGYSWGASIAFNILMRRPEISSFVLISPTLSLKNCDFLSFLSVFKTTGLIVHGENDQITSVNTLLNYVKLLQSKKMNITHHILPNTDHYYNNGIEKLLEHFNNFINSLGNNPHFNISMTQNNTIINKNTSSAPIVSSPIPKITDDN
jgi:alpha/beta superfamily hydrolase